MGYISNHSERLLQLVLSQYRDSTKLKGLISAFGDQIQEIEDVLQGVLDLDNISAATGRALDELGTIPVQPRNGMSDSEYRAWMRLRIAINHSGGTPPQIITAAKAISSAAGVVYREKYPAKITLEIYGGTLSSDLKKSLDRLLVGGVKLDVMILTNSNPYVLGRADGTIPAIGGGLSSTTQNTGGQFVAILT